MNSSPPSPHDRWNDLIQRARTDAPPPIDLSATLRAVRAAASQPPSWLEDFAALFATRSALRICLLGAAAFATLATWQVWNFSEALPWVQLISPTVGGLL